MNRTLIISFCAALLPFTFTVRADDVSEAKTKQQLIATTQQLRAAQQEKATMQAAQAQLEASNKTLTEQVKTQAKSLVDMDAQMKSDQKKSEDILNEKVAAITRLELKLAEYKTSLDKWQAAHIAINAIAKKKEAERAKLAAKSADLERKVTDLRARNAELYRLAGEILARYEKFGIGEALAAREPFTGNAKVKLLNIVQDYNDKLLDQTAKP